MQTIQCEKFPNTAIHYGARKIGQGDFRGYFRGYVTCVERSAWLTPTAYTKRSDVVRVTREDALSDATKAAEEAAKTGFIPAF